MSKKYNLVTSRVKKQARKIKFKNAQNDRHFNHLVKREKRKEETYLKKNQEFLNKPRRTKRYYIQKAQGHLTDVERPRHYIPKQQQLKIKYRNERFGNKYENIYMEHKNRDLVDAVLKVGESQIFKNPIQRMEVTKDGETLSSPIELENSDLVNKTKEVSQEYLLKNVDLNSQRKVFDIELAGQGGFRVQYNQSGRHILMGGIRGLLSAFDWRNFKLIFECRNIGNGISDVKWLMDDSLIAVANFKSKTQIFDDKGALIHVLHDFKKVEYLEYLLFHFLLVGGNGQIGEIYYKDISLGETISTLKLKKFLSMCQNPYNALICTGHFDGTVSMSTPRDPENEPVISMLTHNAPVSHVLCDDTGKYLVTASTDNTIKIWDIRKTFKPLGKKEAGSKKINSMAISQSGMIAYSVGNNVRVLKDFFSKNSESSKVYMKHTVNSGVISSLNFCNYEDVLGIGYSGGFSSILIPGSGNSVLDSREPNPYFTDAQVKKWNVDRLLEKIPWEMICLDPSVIASSGKTSSGIMRLNKDIKEKIKELDYEVKEGNEREDRFFEMSRFERAEAIQKSKNEFKKKKTKEKKWYQKSNGDALMRFGEVKKMEPSKNDFEESLEKEMEELLQGDDDVIVVGKRKKEEEEGEEEEYPSKIRKME